MGTDKPSGVSENRVYIGAYGFCRDREGRLLLARLRTGPDEGKWTLPGGGVMWGEHPSQAVIRELEEETGLVDLELGSLIAVYSHIYHRTPDNPLPPLHHVGIIYQIAPLSYGLKFEIGGTTDICQWLTEDEARDLPMTPLGDFGLNLAWAKEDD